MQNSQANTEKIFTKFFWRAGKVRIYDFTINLVKGLLGTGCPDPTLASASPSPPQGSIWHRFNIDSTPPLTTLTSLTLQSFFFDFLALFCFPISLAFSCVFLSFPRILGVPRREKPLLFFGVPLAFFKKQGLEGQGFEIAYCGFILGKSIFVIISVKNPGQNLVRNFWRTPQLVDNF